MEKTQTGWSSLSAVWAKNKAISFIVDGLTSHVRPRFSWKNMVNTDLYKKMFQPWLGQWPNKMRECN